VRAKETWGFGGGYFLRESFGSSFGFVLYPSDYPVSNLKDGWLFHVAFPIAILPFSVLEIVVSIPGTFEFFKR
jgi:hypothetical protein